MRGFATAILVLVALGPQASAQPANSSLGAEDRAYTQLDLKACKHTKGRGVEDYGSWHCAGYGGIPIHVSAGDQRTYISYGATAAKELAARQTLASFNSEGKTIEWRLARDSDGRPRPYATILRWNTTTIDDDNPDRPFAGQVLVVTRLPPGSVCHVGYVDGRANENANELARQIADERARNFKCGSNKPVTLGAKGKGFSGLYGARD